MNGARFRSLRCGRGLVALAAGALLLAGAVSARAETLVTALSADRIDITSNFSGHDLQVFGVVEHDRPGTDQPAPFDVVVTVTGPAERVAVRRKEHVAGVWLNRSATTFIGVPAFYALATSAPLDRIAAADALTAAGIGAGGGMLVPEKALPPEEAAYWRAALVAERSRAGTWQEAVGGVDLITPRFFRAPVRLPAHIGAGDYEVTVSLFSGGRRIALDRQTFSIAKSGFEARVADLSRGSPILYGLAVVVMALGTGWIGGVVFRRD